MKSNHSSKRDSSQPLSKVDYFLWMLVFLLFFSGLVVTYYYSNLPSPVKFSIWIFLLLASAGLISRTKKGKAILEFGKKARGELRKVVWPTRQEVIQVTAIVGLIVLVMSLVLWVIDSGLVWLAGLATGQKG